MLATSHCLRLIPRVGIWHMQVPIHQRHWCLHWSGKGSCGSSNAVRGLDTPRRLDTSGKGSCGSSNAVRGLDTSRRLDTSRLTSVLGVMQVQPLDSSWL